MTAVPSLGCQADWGAACMTPIPAPASSLSPPHARVLPATPTRARKAEEQIPNQDGAIKSPKCFSVPTIKLCHWGMARRYLPSLSPEGGVTLHCSPVLPTDMEGTPSTSWDGHKVPLLLAPCMGMLWKRAELPAQVLVPHSSVEQGEEKKAAAATEGHRNSPAPNGSNSS